MLAIGPEKLIVAPSYAADAQAFDEWAEPVCIHARWFPRRHKPADLHNFSAKTRLGCGDAKANQTVNLAWSVFTVRPTINRNVP